MTRNLEKRAAKLAAALRRAGFDEEAVQRRVDKALARARGRKTKPTVNNPLSERRTQSVTSTARDLRMKRGDLFLWLQREGWLYRTTHGWRATDDAMAAGWAVMRGARAVRWPQLTPAGAKEIASRLGIAVKATPPESGA